jgi:hypothetical protein
MNMDTTIPSAQDCAFDVDTGDDCDSTSGVADAVFIAAVQTGLTQYLLFTPPGFAS